MANHRTGEMPANQMKLKACRFTLMHQIRSSRNIDNALSKSFIQWNSSHSKTADAGFISQCFTQNFSEHDGSVFHRMVNIDMGITCAFNGHIDERVLG
ncbi:Uncharacterised protein [Mycobacteroides abscessus subsp. abscessus]|nr:Uncharacterised protein [Mycobacteroides abscessus subsp. abscessus]